MKDIRPLFNYDAEGPLYIAGPCSAESREQVLAAAAGVANAGIKVFRAGVWKPRTKPGMFEGIGSAALEWLMEAKRIYGLNIVTEVATPDHLEAALKAGVDGVWIGARTTTNPFATQQVADALRGVDTTVLVKNPVIPDVNLWIGAIERIYGSGVRRIGAVHRGFGTHQATMYRNDPHWSVPIELHRLLPHMTILSDPSHIGGRRDLIAPLSQQALDFGFSGLMVECHPTPDTALSDATQQITPESFAEILKQIVWRRTPANADSLRDFRLHIDSIDSRLIELLAERMEVARGIGELKRHHGMAIVQRERFNELLEAAEGRATAMGLSTTFIHQIFSAIHEESVRQQTENIKKS
ncbi:MAG: bifunctional 3-deoxy-7-phosphoheptulonate synthase/chorismate mutase type II [Alistipes sp.]|nr:bifunctional 3-deoxy-7-phosphoheptulonate synthase/chorismate mutase type II [Alistipes sp.]